MIGSPNQNSSQGDAYVFVQSDGMWTEQAELTASDGAFGDNFGQSVSVSGSLAVIGAPNQNSSQGAALCCSNQTECGATRGTDGLR